MLALLCTIALASPRLLLAPAQGNAQKWVPPYEAIAQPADYLTFKDRLGSESTGIFIGKDRITMLAKGNKNSLVIPGWLPFTFTRDESADLWVAQGKMKDWDRSFFTYNIRDAKGFSTEVFYGPKAPSAPMKAEKLAGSLQTIAFPSKFLGESRDITVYLPPNPKSGLKAIYMSDGQSCEDFAKVVEPLIIAKKIAPTAIIGLFHGPYKGDISKYDMNVDFRAREYLKIADPERFASHLSFVVEEVIPWAEAKFGLQTGSQNRALFGYSNGGAFALMASAEKPDVFGSVLPFSIAVYDREDLKKIAKGAKLPKYWMTAGTMESFVNATGEAEKILKDNGAKVCFDRYVSGHDGALWQLALARDLPQIFPARS